jgi:formylglycine-generating enzyme required for sulfatase activity
MNAALTRTLAALQARSHLLSTQGGLLSDLGDIKECRRLRDEIEATVKESAAKGLTPPNPLEVVLADWRRLVAWSDEVQGRLKRVDEICRDRRGLNGSKGVKLDWLERWQKRLELAPRELGPRLDDARKVILSGDWQNGEVHPETLEVGTVMAPTLKLEYASGEESPGTEPAPAAILASSWRALQPGSPEVAARLQLIRAARAEAETALAEFPRHQAVLAEVQQLLGAGELTAAETKLKGLKPLFSELDYSELGKSIGERRKRINKTSDDLSEIQKDVEKWVQRFEVGTYNVLAKEAEDLIARLKSLQDAAAKESRKLGDGEAGNIWINLIRDIQRERVSVEDQWGRLRRKSLIGMALFGTMVVAVLGGGWLYSSHLDAKAKAEAARLAAVRAEEERVEAAKTKAEAEAKAEAERVASAKTKAEAEAKAEAELVAAVNAKAEFRGRMAAAKAWLAENITLELVVVTGGTFAMGQPSRPLQVTLGDFGLGKTEVTQAQWKTIVMGNPSRFEGDDLPVENVSWENAMAFCRKLTERARAAGKLSAGFEFTLPTEAQWEYACRAGNTGHYEGGDAEADLAAMAWYDANSRQKTQPVGTKQPNPWGFHDMHGNVAEWCRDWFGNYESFGPMSEPKGPAAGFERVQRGGGYSDGSYVRFFYHRQGRHPSEAKSYSGITSDRGFRIALVFVP